jgi:hypothetical protein
MAGECNRPIHVWHLDREVTDSVAMGCHPLGKWCASAGWPGEHEPNLARDQHVLHRIPVTLFRTAVSNTGHAKCCRVEVRSLPGIANGEANVVHADDWKRIRPKVVYDATDEAVDITTFRRPEQCGHYVMLTRRYYCPSRFGTEKQHP